MFRGMAQEQARHSALDMIQQTNPMMESRHVRRAEGHVPAVSSLAPAGEVIIVDPRTRRVIQVDD